MVIKIQNLLESKIDEFQFNRELLKLIIDKRNNLEFSTIFSVIERFIKKNNKKNILFIVKMNLNKSLIDQLIFHFLKINKNCNLILVFELYVNKYICVINEKIILFDDITFILQNIDQFLINYNDFSKPNKIFIKIHTELNYYLPSDSNLRKLIYRLNSIPYSLNLNSILVVINQLIQERTIIIIDKNSNKTFISMNDLKNILQNKVNYNYSKI